MVSGRDSPRCITGKEARRAAPHLVRVGRQATEADAAQVSSIDVGALDGLRAVLMESDLEAVARFRALAPALQHALEERDFRRLEEAMAGFDFVEAAALLPARASA